MMNKQGNLYTILYIIVIVVVVGAALAFTSLSLKDKQNENIAADNMRQILASLHIVPAQDSILEVFDKVITRQFIVDSKANVIDGEAFAVDIASEVKRPADERKLPVYEAAVTDGSVKYVLPIYGAGLWGPIWGYVAMDSDGSTIFGAYFAHQGETPGLGAEIEKPKFSAEFVGKQMFKDDVFKPIAVVKAGQHPATGEDYVDGVSGGTITSKGVNDMLAECLRPYEMYLQTLRNK